MGINSQGFEVLKDRNFSVLLEQNTRICFSLSSPQSIGEETYWALFGDSHSGEGEDIDDEDDKDD